jgi:hypothetical protein
MMVANRACLQAGLLRMTGFKATLLAKAIEQGTSDVTGRTAGADMATMETDTSVM